MSVTNENVRLVKPFLRGLPIIVAAMAICMLAAKRYLNYATPMYESMAKIRLADPKDGSPSSNLYKDFDVFVFANKIGAEVEVLKSKVLIDKALDSLAFDITTYRVGKLRKIELYRESPFLVQAKHQHGGWYDKPFQLTILSSTEYKVKCPGSEKIFHSFFGKPVVYLGDTLVIERNETLISNKPNLLLADQYEFVIHSRQKLYDEIVGSLDVTSIDKEVPILRIAFKSPVAQKTADFVNRLAQTYIEDFIDTKYKSAHVTEKFLNRQLSEVGGKLASSENAIEQYRDENRIINIRQETETDLRKIADMKVQQTNVKMNLEAVEDLYGYMKSGKDPLELAPNFEAYTDLLATELVKKMKLLQAQKKELLIKYTPEHEQVKVIDEQLKDITQYLEEGINNSRKNLLVKYERISDDIYRAEEAFNGLPTREKTLGILSRNFLLNEQAYNFLHEKRTEAQIASAANISFHRIISQADVPEAPVSPNATLLKLLAGFLGFLGSVFLIYLVHAIKGKVNDVTTIEKNAAIPVAACTPKLNNPAAIRSHFHKLAVQLEIKGFLQPHSMLVLSSFDAREGKTFNSLHIANELASQSRSVLLADVDGSFAAKQIEIEGKAFDYVDFRLINNFSNPGQVREQLNVWKKQYDLVIVKNENIINASDGLLLMKEACSNLFVLDARRTAASRIAEAELLQDEFQFGKMQFLLNRDGYNPNIILQLVEMVKHLFHLFNKNTPLK